MGGPAKATKVAVSPSGVAFGGGSLYIADALSVRKVNPATDGLTTPAGSGAQLPLGDGGQATKAAIVGPSGVAVDGSGNLLIADRHYQGDPGPSIDRVRLVAARTGTFYGRAMTAGDIFTVAGTGRCGFAGDGGPAARAKVCSPGGVAADGSGNPLGIDEFVNKRLFYVEK